MALALNSHRIIEYVTHTPKEINIVDSNRSSGDSGHHGRACARGIPTRMLMPLPGGAGVGGAHISALLLGEGLEKTFGWDITYTLQPGSSSAEIFARYDVSILRSPERLRWPMKNSRSRLDRGYLFLTRFADALRIIRKVRPHYITLNLKNGFLSWALAAKLTGTPVIWYVRGIGNQGWDNRLRVRLSNKIIFAAEAVRSAYSNDKLPPNCTIRNGVRPRFFATSRGSTRAEFGVAENQLLVVFIGNMVERKRPAWAAKVVCEAIKAGVDLRFVMIGERRDCSIVSKVRAIFDRYDESARLTIAGFRDDIADVMEAADILVLTSHRDGEAFPRVIIEAMAKELCVVATDVAGVGEAVTNRETGFLVSPDNEAAFTSVLMELGEDPKLRQRVAANAKRKAETRFTQKQVVEQFQSFISN